MHLYEDIQNFIYMIQKRLNIVESEKKKKYGNKIEKLRQELWS